MKQLLQNKIIIILIFTLMMIVSLSTTAYANSLSLSDTITAGDNFLAAGDEVNDVIDNDAVKNASSDIYNVLFTIGVILAVGVGMVIGIQFITGSIEEQAKIKETLIPYVIGVFVIFSAFGIWKIVINIGNEAFATYKMQDKQIYVATIENNNQYHLSI